MNDNVSSFNAISRETVLAARCKAIAHDIDPQAADFFRRCLEKAARMGMQFIIDEEKKK